jgi:(p)ppGpp synthase/HD superfamily hydrolase
MIFTPLIQKAITFATTVHAGQTRKGKKTPYITHPLSVALILSRVSHNQNIITAGILHDTIEDCEPEGSVTKEIIEKEFNPSIARMVSDVTEEDKSLPWLERKMAALKHLKKMQPDSQLVKSADVLHNLTDLVEDLKKDGDKIWERFNATKEDTLMRYDAIIPEIKRVWPKNPLIQDLLSAHQTLKRITHDK